jgi:hypothetical protein
LTWTLFLAVASTSVTAPITHFVSVEVIEGLLSTFRMWTSVAVMWIEAVVNVAVEVVRSVEPRAGSDEQTAVEPLGPIISVRGAVIRGEVIVAIGTRRLWSDIDGDLGGRGPRDAQQSANHDRDGKKFQVAHVFLLISKKSNPGAKVVMTERDHICGKERRKLGRTLKSALSE